jgi:hypothetical protein
MNELIKLHDNPMLVIEQEKLLSFLNKEPPSKWVKIHPVIKHKYLPIDKVEFLLKAIFKQYKIEVLKTGMLMNAVEVSIRVHYLDPLTNVWMFYDGVGAQELQTKSGSGPLKMDMSNVNNGAVTMALPIAKTMAIKDACDHFGAIFGSNLGRKDTLVFEEQSMPDPLNQRMVALINAATSIEELENLKPHLKPELQLLWDNKASSLRSEQARAAK